MPTNPKEPKVGLSPEALQSLAASVHTYESFGRTIISQVLAETAKGHPTVAGQGVQAHFSVQHSPGRVATVAPGAPHCVSVTVSVGDYIGWFEVCLPSVSGGVQHF